MSFQPIHDRVLVKRIEAEEKTAGGIILPEVAQEAPQEGVVIAAGNGVRDNNGNIIPPAVHAGDKVLFGKYAGTEVLVDGVEHVVLLESDILGILS